MPKLIMLRISGYGQTGPYKDRPGFGVVAEAMGGLRHLTAEPGRVPVRVGVSIGDTLASLHGVIGVLMMPWKLLANPESYIFDWLVGYSALLGPIGGILIADYFVYRRRRLNLASLYQPDGDYRFTHGFSLVAIVALLLGVLPSLPGFLVQVKRLDPNHVSPFLVGLFHYAWFVGFAVAFGVYLAGRKGCSAERIPAE